MFRCRRALSELCSGDATKRTTASVLLYVISLDSASKNRRWRDAMPASDVSAARGPTKSNLGDKGLLFYSDRIRTGGPRKSALSNRWKWQFLWCHRKSEEVAKAWTSQSHNLEDGRIAAWIPKPDRTQENTERELITSSAGRLESFLIYQR